jgi:hypothetical protein
MKNIKAISTQLWRTVKDGEPYDLTISDADFAQIGKTKQFDLSQTPPVIVDIPQAEIAEREAQRAARIAAAQKARQISDLKRQLTATDYKAIKYAEGQYTDAEYAETRAAREALREQIRTLEE